MCAVNSLRCSALLNALRRPGERTVRRSMMPFARSICAALSLSRASAAAAAARRSSARLFACFRAACDGADAPLSDELPHTQGLPNNSVHQMTIYAAKASLTRSCEHHMSYRWSCPGTIVTSRLRLCSACSCIVAACPIAFSSCAAARARASASAPACSPRSFADSCARRAPIANDRGALDTVPMLSYTVHVL